MRVSSRTPDWGEKVAAYGYPANQNARLKMNSLRWWLSIHCRLLGNLSLRLHERRFLSLSQQLFSEVQTVAGLIQLALQLTHFALEKLDARIAPSLIRTAPQLLAEVLCPYSESDRQSDVKRAMPELAFHNRKAGSRHVPDAEQNGGRVPARGFEGHDQLLLRSTGLSVGRVKAFGEPA